MNSLDREPSQVRQVESENPGHVVSTHGSDEAGIIHLHALNPMRDDDPKFFTQLNQPLAAASSQNARARVLP
jgi:hypothetical protein